MIDTAYLRVTGWGLFFLCTILDDYALCIVAWRLDVTTTAGDVTATVEDGLVASSCDKAMVTHRPRLPSDNGNNYISGELANWLDGQRMIHVPGGAKSSLEARQDLLSAFASQLPAGQRSRWHQPLKNRIVAGEP